MRRTTLFALLVALLAACVTNDQQVQTSEPEADSQQAKLEVVKF